MKLNKFLGISIYLYTSFQDIFLRDNLNELYSFQKT